MAQAATVNDSASRVACAIAEAGALENRPPDHYKPPFGFFWKSIEVQPDRQNRADQRRTHRRGQIRELVGGIPRRPLPHVPGAAGRDDAGSAHAGGYVAAASAKRVWQVDGGAKGSPQREIR